MSIPRTILAFILCCSGAAFLALGSCQDDAGRVPAWGERLPGKVLYVRHRGPGTELVQVGANGDGEQVVDLPTETAAIVQPAWTDRGDALAYSGLTDGRWSRFRLDLATGDLSKASGPDALQLVTRKGHADDLYVDADGVFAVADDGERSLLVACAGHDEGDSEAPRTCANVRWGPDKRYVVMQRCGSGDDCEVVVASRDNHDSFVLARGKHPDWVW